MRIPSYQSYSAFSQFEKDRQEHYLKYLASSRAARLPQERPASIGSAFDAYAKSNLYYDLFGKGDPKYELTALFEAQVEPHNRDWAWEEGQYVFDCYKLAGQYDRLLGLLKQSIEPPRFEFEIRVTILGVPFLGKPDCRFVLPGPLPIVHDFKVNGYCSKSAVSPTKGYMLCTDGYTDTKPSKSHNTSHKQFAPELINGIPVDTNCLEDCSEEWADQLSLYAWAMGEEVGSPFVLSIDQIVAKPIPEARPLLRVASFRARVRKSYQQHLAKRFQDVWQIITSGHIFPDLTKEESDQRCQLLEKQSVALRSDGSETENFFNEAVRPAYRG